MRPYLFFITIFFYVHSAWAQINFDEIIYRGSGCPEGTVRTVVSPDGESLSLLFDQFRSEVPQFNQANDNETYSRRVLRNGQALNHKNCSLSFKAILPVGFKLESVKIELMMRGGVILDSGVEGFFASILVGYTGLVNSRGTPNVLIQKNWRAKNIPTEDEFILNPIKVVKLNSNCSKKNQQVVKFDLKNHIRTEIPDRDLSRSGQIALDSIDSKGMLRFQFTKRRCPGDRLIP